MPDAPSRDARPRLWRLQFSLASVFVLMTVAAIGVWFWYQRPYEVENQQFRPDPDPFAAPGAVAPGKSQPIRVYREVEYVRRIWGGKTVRHGARRIFGPTGNLITSENYRNGQPAGEFVEYYRDTGKKAQLVTFSRGEKDGPSRRWNRNGDLTADENYSRGLRHGRFDMRNADGTQAIEGAFEHGRPAGKWLWLPKGGTIVGQWRDGVPDGRWEWSDGGNQVYLTIDFERGQIASTSGADLDEHLPKLLARIATEDPLALLGLSAAIDLNFARYGPFVTPDVEIAKMPLKDLVDYVKDVTRIPLMLDTRSLEESSIDPDEEITCSAKSKSLLIALGEVLRPYSLGCDYRYGTLWVDTAESIAKWKDGTRVTRLTPPRDTPLAREWNKTTSVDFIEVPLKDVALYLQDRHNGAVRFDISRVPDGPFDPRRPNATKDVPITLQAKAVEFKHCLAMLLNFARCKASLKGETIVLEPQ